MWSVHPTNCQDVIIRNLTIRSTTGNGDCIDIDSTKRVRIEPCTFTRARTFALYIKTRVGRGAFIEDISATDLDVSGTTGGFLRLNLLDSGLQDQAPVPGDEGIPTTRNFRFSNVLLHDCPLLVDAVRIHPAKPLDGFSLVGVSDECPRALLWPNARYAVIRDINVTGLTGPLVSIHNASGQGLEGAAAMEGPKLPDPIPAPAQPYRLH